MKMLVATLVLGFVPALAIAECGHKQSAMSCAAGTVYDADAARCVATTG